MDLYGQRTKVTYSFFPGVAQQIDYLASSTTEYTYDNSGRLVNERCVSVYDDNSTETHEFTYLYDESGIIGAMFSKNGATATPYYYRRNLQGDVTAIYNQSGTKVAEYAYDAWGNCTVTYSGDYNIAYTNPILYRGYYYDRSTGLYYLNARYYNPQWRRFISPSKIEALTANAVNGLNSYIYANNNPVNVKINSCFSSVKSIDEEIASTSAAGSLPFNSLGWFGSMISGLSSVHGFVDKVSSYLVGSMDGLLNYAGIAKLNGFQSKLSTYSKWLLGIGIGLDIAVSAYDNYHNHNLTEGQKWASFVADLGYIGATSALAYGAGILVTKGSVALGTAVAGYTLGATIGGVTIGFAGAIAIGATVVVVGVVAGTILIAVVSDALDNLWEQKKEEWLF
ncbi:MAG: RHS repeat-associated core domain-containing protein [Clostridia bacterium]|nr:RHS repeat-associated core domain-containing protein [Clostridia bacterium]